MDLRIDVGQIHHSGWTRIDAAVPRELCDRLVDALESEVGVPVNDPSRWDVYGGEMRDLVPIWGHQTQWDIRQHPNMHRVWAQLCGTERLGVSLDSCRFTPPWKLGHAEPGAIHWDHNPWNAAKRMFQGVLALTKKHGPAMVEDACAVALETGASNYYRFVRRYLERGPQLPLSLRQVDPLIRELTEYRDFIQSKTRENQS